MSINQVTILGNMTADPELRTTNSGTEVCSIGVATNERVKNGDDWTDKAEFHNIVLWKGNAKYCCSYAQKGTKVAITGKLATSSWEDKDTGKKVYRTEIIANNFMILNNGVPRDEQPEAPAGQPTAEASEVSELEAEDLPF